MKVQFLLRHHMLGTLAGFHSFRALSSLEFFLRAQPCLKDGQTLAQTERKNTLRLIHQVCAGQYLLPPRLLN